MTIELLEITIQKVFKIIPKNCYFCGAELETASAEA
jgi:hypothetical protein